MHLKALCLSPLSALKSGTGGESKGERLGSFSFAISLWNDKEMASISAQRGAKLYARQKEKVWKTLTTSSRAAV